MFITLLRESLSLNFGTTKKRKMKRQSTKVTIVFINISLLGILLPLIFLLNILTSPNISITVNSLNNNITIVPKKCLYYNIFNNRRKYEKRDYC